jgi:hypothetical protein
MNHITRAVKLMAFVALKLMYWINDQRITFDYDI